jgi:hypothetical protein
MILSEISQFRSLAVSVQRFRPHRMLLTPAVSQHTIPRIPPSQPADHPSPTKKGFANVTLAEDLPKREEQVPQGLFPRQVLIADSPRCKRAPNQWEPSRCPCAPRHSIRPAHVSW